MGFTKMEVFQYVFPTAAFFIGLFGAQWLSRKPARRLRLKVGLVEVEANTQEELDELLKKARAAQNYEPRV
jgi:hypothetical protein